MGVELVVKGQLAGPWCRKFRVLCEIWAGDVLTVKAITVFVMADTGCLRSVAHAPLVATTHLC